MTYLKRWVVPVDLIVYGETEHDAREYVLDALNSPDFLSLDGMAGFDDEIELMDIEEQA